MDSKVYLYEKAREAHYQDLLREAEKERLLRHLPPASSEHEQACSR